MFFQLKSDGMAALAAGPKAAGHGTASTTPILNRPLGGLNTKVKP